MLQRFRFRFSLLSLLLLTTVAAVAVSHCLTSRRLSVARLELEAQRESIRELSHELGQLTVEDRFEAHVQRRADETKRRPGQDAYRRFEFRWLIHLPSHKRWRVAWAAERIPVEGIPTSVAGYFDFTPPASGDWASLELRFSAAADNAWTASIFSEYDHAWHACEITWEQGHWLEPGAQTEEVIFGPGSPHISSKFTTYSCDQPLVIFREFQTSQGEPTGSGFALWAEPRGDAIPVNVESHRADKK